MGQGNKDRKSYLSNKNEEKSVDPKKIYLGSYGPPETNYENASLRYPSDQDIGINSDYVLFEFKKYKPPFQNATRKSDKGDGTQEKAQHGQYDYNRAGEYEDAEPEYKSIIMYMPEDVSTGFKGNWGGKAFSTFGADAMRAMGQAGVGNKIASTLKVGGNQLKKAVQLGGAQVISDAIKGITGDVISNDDIFGSISGAILNPNTELLFSAVDMRNFQLQFQLVPRNGGEADIVNEIAQIFKMCTLPKRDPGNVLGSNNDAIDAAFIGVPNLCRVSFMRGAEEHDVLPRYKMCAVTGADVNYTPDGTYATYPDGQPVAMQLKINFQETKIVFADEVQSGDIR
tara:strand:- start:6337 stop:7359 length:1023 start_codon:yes stop_codon:yes gene_type:complete